VLGRGVLEQAVDDGGAAETGHDQATTEVRRETVDGLSRRISCTHCT